MILCIEKQYYFWKCKGIQYGIGPDSLFLKGTLIVGESNLFFGDFSRKLNLLFLSLGRTILENTRILAGMLNVCFQTKL